MERLPTLPEELLNMVKALAIAAEHNFMAHDHAAAIWKKLLAVSGFDVTKLPIIKKQNATIKKS